MQGIDDGDWETLQGVLQSARPPDDGALLFLTTRAERDDGDGRWKFPRTAAGKAAAEFLRTCTTDSPISTIVRPYAVEDGSWAGLVGLQAGDLIPARVRLGLQKSDLSLGRYLFHYPRMTEDAVKFFSLMNRLLINCRDPYDDGGSFQGRDRVPSWPPDDVRCPGSPTCDVRNCPECRNLTFGRDAMFLQTGAWFGVGSEEWHPTPLGGSDVHRPLRRYQGAVVDNDNQCTKDHKTNNGLTYGIEVYTCHDCSRIVGFHTMDTPETVAWVHAAVYCRFKKAPDVIVMDEGCKLAVTMTRREPQYYQRTDFRVDAIHFRGHTSCHASLNSQHDPTIRNSVIHEQKNSILDRITKQCVYMSQPVYLLFLRYFVYMMNRSTDWKHRPEAPNEPVPLLEGEHAE